MGRLVTALVSVPLLLSCSRAREQSEGAGSVRSSAAAAPSINVADVEQQTPEAAVKAWNDALNRQDLTALRAAYARDVMFYGRRMSVEEVVAVKVKAFANDPDLRQELSNLSSSASPEFVTIRFVKSWTTKGRTRQVEGSLELKRIDGRLLVTAETDVATSDAQAKTWRCGNCRIARNNGPDQLTSSGVEPTLFAWTVEVARAAIVRKMDLSDSLQSVDLGDVGVGWSCSVSATVGHLARGPSGESSTFYVESRQLYCSQVGGGAVKLITDVSCSPRGSETSSEYIELSPGNKVQLTCSTSPGQ
jgi:predicted ester cyclase